jgi:hypothetical protein
MTAITWPYPVIRLKASRPGRRPGFAEASVFAKASADELG